MRYTERDVDVLARTLYGEAEGRNELDAYAIAHVVANRCLHPKLWSDVPAEVCTQPWQFSCWNVGDPNRVRIAKVTDKDIWFARCRQIAREVLEQGGTAKDVTHESTHYYESRVKKPKWARGKTPVYAVEHRGGSAHLFYNNIDTKAPERARDALEEVRPLGSTRTVQGAQVAGVAAAASVATPFVPLLQSIAEYAPVVLGLIVIAAVAWIVYARLDDRNKGVR